MALSHHPQYMTVEEYLALAQDSDVRYEYIDGEVTMMAGGSLKHADFSDNIVTLFADIYDGIRFPAGGNDDGDQPA